MSEPTALIGHNIGETNLARLRERFPTVRFIPAWEPGALLAAAPEADIVFTKGLPADFVAQAPRLRWVQAGTAGIEHALRAGLMERPDIVLTNARGAHGIPMAENILAMMLAFAIRLHTLVRAQEGRRWIKAQAIAEKFELHGQTLCVVGLGDIGGTLARKARGLGMRVIGVRRGGAPHPDVEAVYPPERLAEAVALADHVALCLPLTGETRGLFGERELRAMKSTAYIYNVGRGASLDKDALVRALQEGWIAGAGLDVTDPEPLPEDSSLWDMPEVLLSQHSSGDSPHNSDRITAIFSDNLARYLAGEPLENVVDRARGY
jgi:phosphoglycerate dehydrogenase-like enzyme